jgi:hypothetical protein
MTTLPSVTGSTLRHTSRQWRLIKSVSILFALFLLVACSSIDGSSSETVSARSFHSTHSSPLRLSRGGDNFRFTDDVTGTVTWPDGEPASNAVIAFFPYGYGFGGQSNGVIQVPTDAQGQYAISGCGCDALGATYYLNYSRNAGSNCYIIMQSDSGSYTVTASPGDVANWRMLDMPCSKNYLTPATLGKTFALMQSHPEISSGSWRQARLRSGG